MKVAMLGWEFPPFTAGGLGVHCLELTRALSRRGVDIDFYMPAMGEGGSGNMAERHRHLRIREVSAGEPINPYDQRADGYGDDFNANVMRYNARLVDSFRPNGAQVIHCHDWITVPAALELRERTGLPLVFTTHSTEHDRSAGFWAQGWIEEIERDAVHQADRIIAVSNYTKGLLMRLYDAPAEKIDAIHNGIDSKGFAIQDAGSRDGTVLFLSRLCRQKGPLYFLRAARKVLEKRPQTDFTIAGHGDMLQECIDYTLRHGIADRVRFTGFIPDGELASTYRENQVYVLPSVSEPFGISALEAMASGVPTIVSRNSGVAEAVRHALKVDHEDVDQMAELILHVLQSPALSSELSRNGGREALRFDWDTCAQRTLEAYHQALRARGSAPVVPDPPTLAPLLITPQTNEAIA